MYSCHVVYHCGMGLGKANIYRSGGHSAEAASESKYVECYSINHPRYCPMRMI